MSPKDENELQHMLESALSYSHPVAIRFPKGKGLGVPLDKEFKKIPLGQSELLKEGKHLLIAFGSMVYPALEAARRLDKEGISMAVVNARFAKPLDEKMILSFAQRKRIIITAEEAVTAGGFGSAVRELLDREKKFNIRFKRIGLPLDIYPVGKTEQIKKKYLLDEEGLFQQIKDFYK
jgi:1-deoxy-D-xylulose-5-phosphate synthase